MFRRRRFIRPNPLNPDQMATLVRANRLVSEGRPLEAGPLFALVAEALQQSRHPRRAANLYARASHSFADGNDEQATLKYARQALSLFAQTKMVPRQAAFYTNITRKLSTKGMAKAAAELQGEFGDQVAALPARLRLAPQPRHGLLPTTCPKCGAPMHADALEWVDEHTVECVYCGTLIREE